MIQAKCIQKFRDKNNHIYGYRLQDKKGQVLDVKPDKLKQAIKNNQITIINLTLTADNRLIDIKSQHQQSDKKQTQSQQIEEQKLQKIITKARLLGISKNIQTFCGHTCELISLSDKHIIIIPDDVTKLNGNTGKLTFTTHIQQLQGTIKVIGGKNLRDVSHMFEECEAQSLDLSSFDTSKVTTMKAMFSGCQAQSLDLSSFDTSKVRNMEAMFSGCQAQSLDLSSFDTSNVADMIEMFEGCQAQSLDLSSFNTSNVTDMICMFCDCQAQSLDLSSFDISNVKNMLWMFIGCQAQQIKATDTEILREYYLFKENNNESR